MTDARPPRDDCLNRRTGRAKIRYPNAQAAWFVVKLSGEGLFMRDGKRRAAQKLYAYLCPKCDGWHLASCKSDGDRRRRNRGIAELERRLARAGGNENVATSGQNESP